MHVEPKAVAGAQKGWALNVHRETRSGPDSSQVCMKVLSKGGDSLDPLGRVVGNVDAQARDQIVDIIEDVVAGSVERLVLKEVVS